MREHTFVAKRKCKCPRCGLDAMPGKRGMCANHYQQIWYRINVKKQFASWEELERRGKVDPIDSIDEWLAS